MINSVPVSQDATIATTDVTSALDAILTTDKFLASPQMSAFLRYVVEQTLIGNTRRIKAFTVGIEALGKPASFDPQTDPSVRVLAKRLRSSLDTYYVQNPETMVFIEMKPGSYVPKFLLRSEMPAPMHNGLAPAQQPAATPAQYHQAAAVESAQTVQTQSNLGDSPAVNEPQHSAHLSVQTQTNGHNAQEHGEAATTNEDQEDQEDRNNSINKLWQAYKSSSKVA